MYLKHFDLKEFPFLLTPNPDFFCRLEGHQAALNVILLSLRSGEDIIKVVGEVGCGKTLLCRLLMELLDKNEFIIAYILNTNLTPSCFYKAIAKELNIPKPLPSEQSDLLEIITKKLTELSAAGKNVVLLIDEAQALPDKTLESIRVLTNLETKSNKLLRVILFGQPELDTKLNQHAMRHLKQRIGFSFHLPLLTRVELDAYLQHRLSKAGYTFGHLFTPKACDLLFRHSQGIPRLINTLCHKAMLAAYGRGETKVDHIAMQAAIDDTITTPVSVQQNKKIKNWGSKVFLFINIGLIIGMALFIGLTLAKHSM